MNLSDKKFLITGGTGSFGETVCKHLLNKDVKEIRIFSRDENKQDKMRRELNDERVTFFIGDIRDYDAVSDSCKQIDYVFHAAALKQVPSCEFYPLEAIKTNVIGTDNLLKASKKNDIKKVVLLVQIRLFIPLIQWGYQKR